MEEKEYDYYEAYQKMMSLKENHRSFEEIVSDLKKELLPVKEESLLVHAMRLIIELEDRASSPLYTHLMSPMRQTLYLIDVYYSIEQREPSVDMDQERWDRIAILLDEIENTYFVTIGFPNNGDIYHDNRDQQISVSLTTFLGYYGNAVLSYEEQTLDRIERYFRPYDGFIKSHFGFTVDNFERFVLHVRRLHNDKYNSIVKSSAKKYSYYNHHPEEWQQLTKKFIDRGVEDPHDWWFQPELAWLLETFQTNPGEVFVHAKDELYNLDIEPDSLQNIIDFLLYDKEKLKGSMVYYADRRYSELHPLFCVGEKYVCTISKFLFESFYFRIDEVLRQDELMGVKYKQNKDFAFEKKVIEIFQRFFPEKTKFFTNYSVDGISENDLLIVYQDICIIVEIKNCGFRAPFRDPLKAYDRIKRDYENAIQLGYEQCRRVENVLMSDKDVDVLDADNKNKVLYRLKNKNIGEVWSIVVTDFKYGVIQTDLKSLLHKDEEALYPWSVCVDDVEAFLLLMRQVLKGMAPARFVEFLDYRERLHGHLLCADELELCGWYLCDREQFKEQADNDIIIDTTPNMAVIFDAYYHVGLGFKNELDMEYKKDYSLPNYPNHFEISELIGEKLRGVTSNYDGRF
jgi:hypothetical protein